MAADVTTGSQVMGTSAGFLLFCAIGIAFTKFIGNPMQRSMLGVETAKRVARLSYWAWAVLVGIGLVAFLVGLVAWMTGTTFRTT